MTWSPSSNALRASATAKSPGTEISARLAAGSRWTAARMVRDDSTAAVAPNVTRLIEQPPRLRERGLSGERIASP